MADESFLKQLMIIVSVTSRSLWRKGNKCFDESVGWTVSWRDWSMLDRDGDAVVTEVAKSRRDDETSNCHY